MQKKIRILKVAMVCFCVYMGVMNCENLIFAKGIVDEPEAEIQMTYISRYSTNLIRL